MAKKTARTPLQTPEINHTQEHAETQMASGYERSREERIKENLERMQKLGIVNLSIQVKSFKSKSRSTPRKYSPASPLPPLGPSRRSSRLQSSTPVSYCEVEVPKKDKSEKFGGNLLILEGSRPEVYTEEHDKLLGSTEQSWALFVDGVGKDGKRIYDSVTGKTCHQCRQKTLGHRTHCSQCSMVQGQFCGDCLYMRYGEHVLEAKQNPDWICPPCRGICNCSLCRKARGWPPTGYLYRKISALGYKSVAHYLIQTRRENTESDHKERKAPTSAKRSLPFAETETASTDMESLEYNYNPQIAFEAPKEGGGSPEPQVKAPHNCDVMKTSEEADFPESEMSKSVGVSSLEANTNLEPNSVNDDPKDVASVKEKEMEITPIPKKNRGHATEPVVDSIARRLRQRRPRVN